jgi:DNA invertase Pin-like site-specific DNA recombinase
LSEPCSALDTPRLFQVEAVKQSCSARGFRAGQDQKGHRCGLGSCHARGVSGALRPESRKRFKAALALLAGESEALIFTKVDRASRWTEDFARLISLSEEQGWRLIVTEMGIDTRTPMGKAMAHMAVVFAELGARLHQDAYPRGAAGQDGDQPSSVR